MGLREQIWVFLVTADKADEFAESKDLDWMIDWAFEAGFNVPSEQPQCEVEGEECVHE